MIKLNKKHTRAGLNEGRSSGISLGFAVKTGKDAYETVSTISPCKDYMNDLIYVETRKVPLATVYGFHHDRIDFLKKVNYMAIECPSYPKHEKMMMANFKNMELFMQRIEKYLNIEFKAKVEKVDNKTLLIHMSDVWCSQPYAISLHGLLFRSAVAYDGKMDIFDYLETKNLYNNEDFLKMTTVIAKIHKLRKIGFVKQDYGTTAPGHYTVHNTGIVGVKL